MNTSKRDYIKRIIRVFIGLILFSYGVHLVIAADIGVAPWDCLGQGIAKHTPLNYGLSMTCISIIVLVIDMLLKEPIGYGMIIDALFTGNMVQVFNDYCVLSNSITGNYFDGIGKIIAGSIMILIGTTLMAIGQMVYMKTGLSCGPRDSLFVGLGKIVKTVPIGVVQNGVLIIVFIAGWLLGGSIGFGTVLGTFGTGIIMQIIFKVFSFEPREVLHENAKETTMMFLYRN